MKKCPSCSKDVDNHIQECPYCHIIFKKWETHSNQKDNYIKKISKANENNDNIKYSFIEIFIDAILMIYLFWLISCTNISSFLKIFFILCIAGLGSRIRSCLNTINTINKNQNK